MAKVRYALLASGASFSCKVFDQLKQAGAIPDLVVLPEFAPSTIDAASISGVIATAEPPGFVRMLASCPLAYAPKVNQFNLVEIIKQHNIDLVLIACWPYLIDRSVFNALASWVNMHPSLLPAYPGANPIEAQLAAAKAEFGVSLHLLNDYFDQGEVIAQQQVVVDPGEASKQLLEQLCAQTGVKLFTRMLTEYSPKK